jgi:hemerythrin-like domain-containing protein
MSDIIQQLKADHRELRFILKKIKNTTTRAKKTRSELLSQLTTKLISHSKAEEETVYLPLQNIEKLHDLIMEGFEEHHVAELLLNEIAGLSNDDEHWIAKIQVLGEALDHHIDEEENEILPKIKTLFKKENLNEMAEDFQERKEQYLHNEKSIDSNRQTLADLLPLSH